MSGELLSTAVLTVFALIAAIIDFKTKRIPNKLVLCMLGVWIFLSAFIVVLSPDEAYYRILDSVFGLVAGGGIFFAVYILSRKGLGGGDVKFMAVAGLYLGLAGTIPAILYGTILAALTGGILILIKKISRKDRIPLAPFLFAGITITLISEMIPYIKT